MPKPKKGQSRNDWMKECVPVVMKEGKTNDQAVGQCMGMWNQHMKNMSKNQLETLTLNLQGDLVRDDKLEGEEYWVAPLAMMMECVANGSNGPMFYPADECENGVPAWNHKPIVVPDHPTTGSACTKDFLNNHKIGLVLNTFWDGKLRAEGWFHKKRTSSIEPRVANALKQRRMMELSTGLYVDPDPVEGDAEFNGEKYIAIARNHRPDHLAILPDKIGAFSIRKGAGMLQLNEASFTEITGKLESALNEKYAADIKKMPSLYLYVMSVYQDYCVYCFGGAYYKIGYSTSGDEVSLSGDPVQVERKFDYVPVANTEDETFLTEDADMPKKELIDKIIKNSERTGYEESDRKMLDGLDEKKLERIAKNAEAPAPTTLELAGVKITSNEELQAAVKKGIEEATKKNDPPNPDPTKNDQNPPPKELTVEEYLGQMPAQLRPVYNNAMQSYQAEVQKLVNTITTNKNNQFKPEYLASLDIQVLRNMAALAGQSAETNQQIVMPNFMGAAGPTQVLNMQSTEEALPLPTYNADRFAAPAKK